MNLFKDRHHIAGALCDRLTSINGALNHDFCPWANRYVYWLKQPIGWFVVGSAAALMIAVFLAAHAWIMFGSLVAVMLMGVAWPWLAMRGVLAEIAFDSRRCREGELVQVRLVIHNRWPWPLWGLAVEKGFFLPGVGLTEQPVTALARVPGWSRSEFRFEFRPSQRGVYPHEVPELVTGFPFGIWRAHREIPVHRHLLVWPRTAPLTSIPCMGGEIADIIGMLFDRPGSEGDTIGVRPFRQGDPLRSIHWAQTARRDAFIVMERQAASRRLVTVIVDLEAFLLAEPQHQSLETAIRVAASVAQEFHVHHAQVRFAMGQVDLTLEPGLTSMHHLLDALARFRVDEQPVQMRCEDTGNATLVLVVTTPSGKTEWDTRMGARRQLRFILIGDETCSDITAWPSRTQVWIELRSGGDCSQQLRRQWERVCHNSTVS